MKRILLFLLINPLLIFISSGQSFTVLTVPFKQHDLSIPHPAYNGQPTTFKAIARSSDPLAEFYYRWDADGDGNWDNMGGTQALPVGKWYKSNGNNLEGKYTLPFVDPTLISRKLYIATIEVTEEFDPWGLPISPKFASYPVVVYSGVPLKVNAASATDEELAVMRDVALDDALWFLHKAMLRGGTDAQITGYLNQTAPQQNIAATALFLQALTMNGHLPGYKPGTYQDYGFPLQPSQSSIFDQRWLTDPYAEDALRALNYLLNKITVSAITSGVGFTYSYSELNDDAHAIIALAGSGMAGTVAQIGDATNVIGKKFETITQKFIDHIAFSQIKSGSDNGGWFYSPGSSTAISYLTGGRIAALQAAEAAMGNYGVSVPQDVKDRMVNMLVTFQKADGSIPYMRSFPESTLEPTPLFLAGAGWLGWNEYPATDDSPVVNPYISITKGQARDVYDKYLKFIADNLYLVNSNFVSLNSLFGLWSDGNYNSGSSTHSFSLTSFNIKFAADNISPKIIKFIPTSGPNINWGRELTVASVRGQLIGGNFTSAPNYWLASLLNSTGQTAMECVTLTPTFFSNEPVAMASALPMTVTAGCTGGENGKVTFSHASSYHLSPSKTIVDYQWIFETTDPAWMMFSSVDWASIPDGGFSADGKAFHTTNRYNTPFYRYNLPGSYNVALRVIDNGTPFNSSISEIKGITVTSPVPQNPAVDTGGPYEINEEEGLTLSGSFINYEMDCDPLATSSASWDLDGDGDFDDFSSAGGSVTGESLKSMNLDPDITHNITLRVINSSGLMATSQTTLMIKRLTTGIGNNIASEYQEKRIFPNPASAELSVEPYEATGELNIEILTISGRKVVKYDQKLAGPTLKINIRNLDKGLYILKISTDGKTDHFRFIKE